MEKTIQSMKDFFSSVLTHLDEGVYYVDRQRQILFWNNSAERLTGYTDKEVIGRYCQDNLLEHVDDEGHCLCLEVCPLAATIEDGENRKANVFLHHKDGHRVPITVQTLPVKDDSGACLGALEIFCENPQREDENDKMKTLARLAYLDCQTNLPNQNYLLMKLKAVLEDITRCKTGYGVIMERIDNYTALSDFFSTSVMDRILGTAGNTMKNNVPASCVVGRWDHQTYLLIVPANNVEMLDVLGRRLARLVEQSTFTVEKETAKSQMSFRCAVLNGAQDERAMLAPILNMTYKK